MSKARLKRELLEKGEEYFNSFDHVKDGNLSGKELTDFYRWGKEYIEKHSILKDVRFYHISDFQCWIDHLPLKQD